MDDNQKNNDEEIVAGSTNVAVAASAPDVDAIAELKNERAPRRYQRRRQGTFVPDYIDWKDTDFLKRFIPERGKIMPRRISGISAKDQRRVSQAIKRARSMALIPFVTD
ncbi:MAG: 30S ribosomal protein S18 [Acidobacteria bacterium]|jgi:small subunit ribosomal protein S18|nr:30S ribosomal protein S18 [Acidobacteriota bacterium]